MAFKKLEAVGDIKIEKGKYIVKVDGVGRSVVAFDKAISEVYVGGQKR